MVKLIGIAGAAGSGKDLAGQYLREILGEEYEIKKFAGKLKQIVALILGCKVEDLEDRDFKNKDLGDDWSNVKIYNMPSMSPFARNKPVNENIPYNDFNSRLLNGEVFNTVSLKRLTPRIILQNLGTEGFRNIIHPNVWVNALFSDYLEESSEWIITDVRFPNEAEAIKARGGYVINLLRESNEDIPKHSSETALKDYVFDLKITNNGTKEYLKETLESWVKSL